MTREVNVDRLMESWLAEGPAQLPDRVVQSILTAVDHQRTPWRLPFGKTVNRVIFAVGSAVALLVAALGVAYYSGYVGPGSPTPETTPEWTGPVRSNANAMPLLQTTQDELKRRVWADDRDAESGWIDVTEVAWRLQEGSPWNIWTLELASKPPLAAELDRNVTLIEYGLVLETTGDGVADYVVGINNDAPVAGDFRTWVTDLAAGTTDEKVGPTYGYPFEFTHPDERQPDDPESLRRTLTFLFMPRGGPFTSLPSAIDPTDRYYTWSSVRQNGEMVAWDYAPDFGWLESGP